MDTNQPVTATPYVPSAPNRGIFGTKIPSSVAFVVGVLLFLMPFVDIKCNNMSLQTVSGIQLATGFKMKNTSSDNSFLDDIKPKGTDETITKTATNTDNKDPNLYAMIALGLGVLGLILSFTNSKAAIGGAMVTGIGAAGALIGMMLDVKKKVKLDIPDIKDKTPDNDVGNTIDKIGDGVNSLTDKVNITVDFTPWFYIAVIAFLAAAFFCYKRMSVNKN
ncbi:MAG TPA: hypothetical protein VMZ03_04985 [Chitinophagaceae bacterium]|nr:hypothetical protein [Chitinophagaceae bacterium]